FFFSSRRRHTRSKRDWSSDVCSSDLADQLIILTDINGLYTDNPMKNPHAKKYSFLEEITDEVLAVASCEGSKLGTGGMKSKLEAAKRALSLGVSTFIGK